MIARKTQFKALLNTAILLLGAALPTAAQTPELMPLDQIKPGMKGEARTVFAGDQSETMQLEVVGILPNLMGPKLDIILVELKGENVEFTGVAGGMSGSPVYIEGKLAGALSLRFGVFAKRPWAGVTPIKDVLAAGRPEGPRTQRAAGDGSLPAADPAYASVQRFDLPQEFATQTGLGAGAFLTPIETPLVFSGIQPQALAPFHSQLASMGLVATHGGTVEPQPDDANIRPGDMVGMVLMQGDLSLQSGCTVTGIFDGLVYVCGHPFLGYGELNFPMTRGRVLTTLSSSMASTKIMNSGGTIGRFTQDRRTAVVGRLGDAPPLIPVELTFVTPAGEKKLQFGAMEHPKLTPLLVAIAVFNGLTGNNEYSEGTTFQLSGGIEIKGYPRVSLENMFAPTDGTLPDGLFVALAVQSTFARIFNNPYQRAGVERVTLRVESVPEWRASSIQSAWSERSEVRPGEPINIKVLLRPYRGAPFIREIPVTIPAQASRGTLRILVSDAATLNRIGNFLAANTSRLAGLGQLITLINRERRNHQLYVTLLQPNPTLVVEDKELPNAPLSQINVLDQQRKGGASILLRESVIGEWSTALGQVITGQHSILITVK
jgi:hypothetical protein